MSGRKSNNRQSGLRRQGRSEALQSLFRKFPTLFFLALACSLNSELSVLADPPPGKSGFLPGARPFGNPFGGTSGEGGSQDPNSHDAYAPSGAKGGHPNPYFDDDDDDDDDVEDGHFGAGAHPLSRYGQDQGHQARQFQNPPASHGNPASRFGSTHSFSAGGNARSEGPEPVMTKNGIAIGGSSANGLVSKGNVPVIKVNDETAEGGKAVISDFNFPDADIMDLARTLGKLTGKNFIFDKDVKGKVSIISNAPITVGEAWKAFLTALDISGFALIPSGSYLRIARQRDARDKQLHTYTGEFSPDTDALITKVIRLKYLNAEEITRTLRSFVPANSRIIPYEQTNSIIVTDTGSNIAKLNKMLEVLDVEDYEAGIEVIPVKYASAAELAKLIDTLIPGTSTGSSPTGGGGAPRFGGFGAAKFSARRTKEGGIINTVLADERTNTLIVHANTKGADQVRELVAKLDQKNIARTGGGKVHVVYLQFADAEQIANTLNNFSTQSTKPTTASTGGGAGGAPTGGTGVNPVAMTLFEGSIKVAPDKATNSLVITASPSDFITVKRVIDRLDIPRNQVYVEVVIMEVAINRSFDFSANILAPGYGVGSLPNPTDLLNYITNPLASSGAIFGYQNATGSLTTATGGTQPTNTIQYTINGTTVNVPTVNALIKAIQANTNSNILATPQIIALDNAEATFESADKIPVQTQTVTGTGIAQNSITKEPVVLSITIKPQINKATNFVKMEVTTKLGDIVPGLVPKSLENSAFATSERTAKTTVVVGDSDSVVLGGLIRDKITETNNKIPILGDIPLLGWLFKSKSTASQKSNLLIFITPHIVRQYEKVRTILDKKLKERDDFIEKTEGGQDIMRDERDDLIRSLPDIKKLTKEAPQTTYTIDEEEDKEGKEVPQKPAAVPVTPTPPPAKLQETTPQTESTPPSPQPTPIGDSTVGSPASTGKSGQVNL